MEEDEDTGLLKGNQMRKTVLLAALVVTGLVFNSGCGTLFRTFQRNDIKGLASETRLREVHCEVYLASARSASPPAEDELLARLMPRRPKAPRPLPAKTPYQAWAEDALEDMGVCINPASSNRMVIRVRRLPCPPGYVDNALYAGMIMLWVLPVGETRDLCAVTIELQTDGGGNIEGNYTIKETFVVSIALAPLMPIGLLLEASEPSVTFRRCVKDFVKQLGKPRPKMEGI